MPLNSVSHIIHSLSFLTVFHYTLSCYVVASHKVIWFLFRRRCERVMYSMRNKSQLLLPKEQMIAAKEKRMDSMLDFIKIAIY
jgi:hypothetical protein